MLSGYFDHGLGTVTSVTADNADSLAARDISMMRARIYAARTGAPNRARALQHLNAGVSEVSSRLPSYRRSHAIRGMKVPELISLRDQATNLLSAARTAASTEHEGTPPASGVRPPSNHTPPARDRPARDRPPARNRPPARDRPPARNRPASGEHNLVDTLLVPEAQGNEEHYNPPPDQTTGGSIVPYVLIGAGVLMVGGIVIYVLTSKRTPPPLPPMEG